MNPSLNLSHKKHLRLWAIDVSTTAGRVTLDGKVDSEEHIACAITLTLETARCLTDK